MTSPLDSRAALAASDGVALRTTLYDAGVPRWFVRHRLRQGVWARAGRRVVVLHNGLLTPSQRRHVAVLECGPRAALDGVSALQHAGVDVRDDGLVHVVVPRGSAPLRVPGVRLHESRRFREDDVVAGPPRRTAVAVAAVHAALWARTDREAVLLLVLPVQRRATTAVAVQDVLRTVRRHKRRTMLGTVLRDLGTGAESLGELDLTAALRRRDLPEPVRQAVRRRPSGTQYLDADFPEHGVTIEVDGAGHDLPEQRLRDLLRDLDLGAEGRTVVRLPLVAWRLDQERVLDALERLFASRGWRRAA